jgi:DNA polymerase III delta prime subunit
MFNNLLIEKYRPHTLEDIVLAEDVKNVFVSFKEKQEIPSLIFLGNPGIGKTSLSKILVKNILQCQYLYINASDENGIDTIRNKVVNFAQTRSIDGKIKVIILDEADALSGEAQRALRNTMEEYSSVTRFILTGNYKYKLIDALRSRCQSFDLTPPLEDVLKRCLYVLKAEKITLPDDQRASFVQLVKSNYPDIRKCINDIQKFSIKGVINIPAECSNQFLTELYNLIKDKKITEVRKFIISNEDQINSDYVNLLRMLFNYIDKNEKNMEIKRMSLLVIAEHIYRAGFVADQEINAYACCVTLTN